MIETVNIPLGEGGDLFDVLLGLLVFAIIAVISLVQKARQRQAEQRAEQERQQQPAQPRRAAKPSPQPQQRPQRQPPARKPALQPEPVMLEPVEGPALFESPPRRRLVQAPQRKQPLATIQRKPLMKRPSLVSKGIMADEGPPERTSLPVGAIVNLADIGEARRAVIYHEIFSPPKALRAGREMWDV